MDALNALESAIVTWNAELEQAGKDIVLTTDPGAGPLIHLALDSPSVDQTLGAVALPAGVVASTKPTQTRPGPRPGIHYTQTANVLLKSSGPSAGQTWATASPEVIERIFLQQLGHVLGLGDATASDSIMSAKGTNSGTTVSCQDLRTLQSL